MPKSDRLLRLLHLLRTLPRPVTAARLSEELEVSLRTLYRDIEALRRAGAQIDGAPGVGFAMTEDIALPPQSLSRLEVEALSFGLSEAQFRGDPEIAEAARSALTKITATLPSLRQQEALHAVTQVYRFTRPASADVDMTVLREACWEEREVTISYRDKQSALTRRTIRPLAVLYFERAVSLLAWCCLREDYRTFLVSEVSDVSALGRSFRPHRATLLRAYVQGLRTSMQALGEDLTLYPGKSD